MSHAETSRQHPAVNAHTVVALLAGALAILPVIETLFISVLFDALTVRSQGLGIGLILQNLGSLPPLIAVAITTAVVFGAKELRDVFNLILSAPASFSQRIVAFVIHLLAYACLLSTSQIVFGETPTESVAWQYLWLGLAGLTFSSWCAIIVSPSALPKLIRRLSPVALFATTLAVLCWSSGQLSERVWWSLAGTTLQICTVVLNFCGLPVVANAQEFSIGTEAFGVTIAPQCSGIEGIGLVCSFMTAYLWFCRHELQLPRSLILLPAAVFIVYFCNIGRIVTLIAIGHWGFPDLAVGAFHSHAGWLLFNAIVIAIVMWSRSSTWLQKPLPTEHLSPAASTAVEPDAAKLDDLPSATSMLLPFIALTLAIPVGQAMFEDGYWFYPVRLLMVGAALGLCMNGFRPGFWRWKFDWAAPLVGLLTFVLWVALEPQAGVAAQRPAFLSEVSVGAAWFWIVCRLVGSIAIAPVAEELAFRGYLIPWLNSATVGPSQHSAQPAVTAIGVGLAVAVSALIFGLLHPGRILAGTLAGLLYGAVLYRRNNVMDCVVAHGTTNGVIAAYVLCSNDWKMWS